ncbi:MAG: YegP family protein [Planctomycetota bacterium]|nr:YegP family protein [Planctomycetota bacterium]
MTAKFKNIRAKNGSFYFNLLAANGEVVLTSQMYASKANTKSNRICSEQRFGTRSV